MDTVLLVLRCVLAVVFATAAVGKLADLKGSREAMTGFGMPARLAAVAGTALPLAELAIAAGLIPAQTARWAALGALVLLLSFIGGIARAMAQGQAPDCHCFGQLHSAPAGKGTLARNAVLAAAAAVVAVGGPGPAIGDWVSDRPDAEVAAVVLGVVAAGLALLCLRLWLDNRELRRRPEASGPDPGSGLPVGSPAPAFEATDLGQRRTRSLDELRAPGRPVALVFMDPGCGPCRSLAPEVRRWQASLAEALTIAVVTKETGGRVEPLYEEVAGNVLVQDRSEVSDAYQVRGTPSAVVVSPAGTVASAPAFGAAAIETLIRVSLQR